MIIGKQKNDVFFFLRNKHTHTHKGEENEF